MQPVWERPRPLAPIPARSWPQKPSRPPSPVVGVCPSTDTWNLQDPARCERQSAQSVAVLHVCTTRFPPSRLSGRRRSRPASDGFATHALSLAARHEDSVDRPLVSRTCPHLRTRLVCSRSRCACGYFMQAPRTGATTGRGADLPKQAIRPRLGTITFGGGTVLPHLSARRRHH